MQLAPDDQRTILEGLGVPIAGKPYRDFFIAASCEALDRCDRLATHGLLVPGWENWRMGEFGREGLDGSRYFHITEEAARAVGWELPF